MPAIRRRPWSILIALAACACAPGASAATFCVSTATALINALNTAEANGEADTINISVGNFLATNLTFFTYDSTENFALAVSGGWTGGCTTQVPGATGTVISGDGRQAALRLWSTGTSSISVRNLTIADGLAIVPGAGLTVGRAGYSGSVHVDSVIIRNNHSLTQAGGLAITTSGYIRVHDSVIRDNVANENFAAAVIDSTTTLAGIRSRFYNNTIVFNTCFDNRPTCDTEGIHVFGGLSDVYNNAFAFHAKADVKCGDGVFTRNNHVRSIIGEPPLANGDFFLADPGFVDETAPTPNLRLTENSPLRNRGTHLRDLSDFDLTGAPRVHNRVDVGAYELQTWQFVDDFETY